MSKTPSDRVQKAAAELAAKVFKGKDAELVRSVRSARLPDGRAVHRFVTHDRKEPNGALHAVVLDDDARETDPATLPADIARSLGAAVRREVTLRSLPLATPAASVSIEPKSNDLVLELGDVEEETVTVTIPPNVGVSKADVYLLADNTGSMGSVIAAVQAGAVDIVNSVPTLDIAFGVGNYRDYPGTVPPFDHQLAPTTDKSAVTAAIGAWTASGGGDGSEGQLFALHQLAEAPGGPIGWRPDSKRIIVWFGDWPGHDPVCAALTGLGFDITEPSVRARLAAENISVLAISTTTGIADGLDGDPTVDAGDYSGTCPIGGTAGQATHIASDTGGTHVSGIDPDEIVDTIKDLIESAVLDIDEVRLEPTAAVAPFVESITPPSYGPLPGDEEHVLPFRVRWRGIKPCGEEETVVSGALNAIADGSIVARKPVRITIPACPPEYVYSVKYVCGTQDDCGCPEAPVRPGRYATEINVHNPSRRTAKVVKRAVPTVTAGIGVAREPRTHGPAGGESIRLPVHAATMDDCKRLAELHYGAPAEGRLPLTIGFLEIVSTEQLVVTAVYTATTPDGGLSMDVETVQPIVRPQLPRRRLEPFPPKLTD